MTGVLGLPCLVRQDIAVGVGVDQRFGFRWSRSDGSLVDLYDYTGVVRLESLSGEAWAEMTPILHEDGLCEVHISPSITTGPLWRARPSGRWSVTVTSPEGAVTCIAAGYLAILDMGVS